jgi:hypothetical protein
MGLFGGEPDIDGFGFLGRLWGTPIRPRSPDKGHSLLNAYALVANLLVHWPIFQGGRLPQRQ